MAEILVLVARIIVIIARGINSNEATMKIAKEQGIDFGLLWELLPNKWK